MEQNKKPTRTCIVCRKEFEKKQLIRVVKNKDGVISVDLSGKSDGRGAYLCKNKDCARKLRKVKAFDRVFKTAVSASVYDEIEGITFDAE